MTRKDYELLAKVLRESVVHRVDGLGRAYLRKSTLVTDLVVALAEDNPRFDSDRFVEACGSVG